MNSIKITNLQYKNLTLLELDDSITNASGKLYNFKYNNIDYVLKTYEKYPEGDELIENFFYTINSLMSNKSIINIEELLIPEEIVTLNNKEIGSITRYIDNYNLYKLLKDYNVSSKEKVSYLMNVGKILEQMKKIRENNLDGDFFIGDLHEHNFIVEKDTKKLFCTDVDSFKICNNEPSTSKYLFLSKGIDKFPRKYVKTNSRYSYRINENTDLFCYNMIILNYIAGLNMSSVDLENFNLYLEYLNKLGYSKELLDSFNNIYSLNDNQNPYYLLDTIPDNLGRSNYRVFKYLKKNNCK